VSLGPSLQVDGGSDRDRRVVAGRYELHERLGTGGMGTVWRGQDVLLGRQVAVKELTVPVGASAADREVLRERMRREARAAAQLDHPDTVTVHDVVEEGAATYLVMQYVEARSLTEVVEQDGPLSPQGAAQVGLVVLGALRAAHAQGIVHRDVKPSNVLVGRPRGGAPGRVLLTDFGIASVPGNPSLTSTGLLIGSPAYIAPERARGDTPGPPSDLWGLGATLFTAVEGRPAYDGGDPMTTLALVMVGEHAPYVRAGILRPVLEGLLERDPARRYTADQAETALREIAAAPADGDTRPAPAVPGAVNPDGSARTAVLQVGQGADAVPVGPPPVPPPSGARRHPAAAAPAAPSGTQPSRRRRVAPLVWAGLLVTAVLGVALVLLLRAGGGALPGGGAATQTGGADSGAATQAGGADSGAATQTGGADSGAADPAPSPDTSGALPLPDSADTPDEQLEATIGALEDRVATDPDAVGPGGEQLLEDLREVARLDGHPRRLAAVVTNDSAGTAAEAGELDADVARQVQQVLDAVAAPARLIDVVQLVDEDPPAIGPAGPELFDALFALDHEVPADETAEAADALARRVTEAVADGEVTEGFARTALPTLQRLADPAAYRALQDLLADVEQDPGSAGPAGDRVLVSLRAVAELPVFPQGNEASALLALVREEGQVTPAFRDEAVPVLTALVR
jgi:hypothetical protein